MINKEFIKNKIIYIQNELKALSKYKSYSFEAIVSNFELHTITERIIERIINDALDINQHIIVESEKKGDIPFDFRESFLLLADFKIYPKNFAERISGSVGLRNILVHQYRRLDEKIFYQSIKDCLQDYIKYCDYILKFLKEKNSIIRWN